MSGNMIPAYCSCTTNPRNKSHSSNCSLPYHYPDLASPDLTCFFIYKRNLNTCCHFTTPVEDSWLIRVMHNMDLPGPELN